MEEKFYIEVNCQQKNHAEERVCGDVFLSSRIQEEGRTIVILSDGLGHGIKANLLATLTSTLAIHFVQEHKSVQKIAEMIIDTLPVDSVKQLNYSTFTIVDIGSEGDITILEYENPKTFIFRGARRIEPVWNCVLLDDEKDAGKEVLTATFKASKEDRIVFCSDGVVQSGLGSDRFLLGWGLDNLEEFVHETIAEEHDISAVKLASRVIDKANQNDDFHPKDDISCAVIYFREPRKLMLCTGPPQNKDFDPEFAEILKSFEGLKIISGATTADVISREWREPVVESNEFNDPDLPPVAYMDGAEIVTEGILTLSKVHEMLKKHTAAMQIGKGPAGQIIKLLLDSDEIHFLVGTSINPAHWDPSFPPDLEWRRTIVHRIARVLEEKFLKEVSMKFY
jgi:hypothetical protein